MASERWRPGSAQIARAAFGDSCVVDFQDFKGLESGVAFDRRNLLLDASRIGDPIRRKLAGYDVILDTGAGDSFTDIYGLRRLMAIAYVQAATKKLPCKLVLGPQTIGPFGSRLGLAVGRRSIRGADLVAARDSVSFDYAASNLTITSKLCATDVVFAIPGCADQAVPRRPARDVIVNVSGLLSGTEIHTSTMGGTANRRTACSGVYWTEGWTWQFFRTSSIILMPTMTCWRPSVSVRPSLISRFWCQPT